MGFLGYNLHVLAKAAWDDVVANPSQFYQALGSRLVTEAQATAWLAKLTADPGVLFMEKLSGEMPRGACVISEDGGESIIAGFLGDAGGEDSDGNPIVARCVEESATLWVMASEEVLGRALASALRTRMIAQSGYFANAAGYLDLNYVGGTPPTAEERVVRKWLMSYVYGLQFTAKLQLTMRDYSSTLSDGIPIVIPSGVVNDDGIEGGVTAAEVV